MSDDKNTCERALELLAADPMATAGEKGVYVSRKVAPAGELSDGFRIARFAPCDRRRWIIVSRGWDTIEIDQRPFGFDHEAMARAAMASAFPELEA